MKIIEKTIYFLRIRKLCTMGRILHKVIFRFEERKIILLSILTRKQTQLLEKNQFCILSILSDCNARIKSNLYLRIRLRRYSLNFLTRGGFLFCLWDNPLLDRSIRAILLRKCLCPLNFKAIPCKYRIHCSKSIRFVSINKSLKIRLN